MKKNITDTHRDGFKTPDNYFVNFQHTLNEKIVVEKKKENKIITLLSSKLKYVFYVAASIVLLLSITFSYNNRHTIETQITSVTDTVESIKESIQLDLMSYNNDDELLALFVEDEQVDEYLDDYLIEGVISQK